MRCGRGEGGRWRDKSLFTTNTDMIHVVLVLSGLPAMVTIAMFARDRYKEGE